MIENTPKQLRRGWTTGACATAATKAAYAALLSGRFPDPVSITLPRGERPAFGLSLKELSTEYARAGIVKDAGDDPDVTHGATIISTVKTLPPGAGVCFRAGEGVGTVTMAGLPIAPGEPAINPVPRLMMRDVISEIAEIHGAAGDVEVEISVPNGMELAKKTWNPRLGIVGGISILGTTGIVHPFSCSAWIASIHRGIDVARAAGLQHIAGATGSTSEAAVKALHRLPDEALIDMGDFVGGMLKYIRTHPVSQVTIAGGFGKITKMAQGALDLHSGRSRVDFNWLSQRAAGLGAGEGLQRQIAAANTAFEVLEHAKNSGLDLGTCIADLAQKTGHDALRGAPVELEVIVVSRKGEVLARAG